LLNVQQAKYLFSTMFLRTKINCDVINVLEPKAMIIWKSFLVCFNNEVNTNYLFEIVGCARLLVLLVRNLGRARSITFFLANTDVVIFHCH